MLKKLVMKNKNRYKKIEIYLFKYYYLNKYQ